MKPWPFRRTGRRDDPYEAEVPCLAGVVIGVREWTLGEDGTTLDPLTNTKSWALDGSPTQAECFGDHTAPDPDCDCGLYAHHPWTTHGRRLTRPMTHRRTQVCGLVYAWGRIEVHREGFRAEFAKPAALFVDVPASERPPASLPDFHERQLRQLAKDCQAEIIDLRDEGAAERWFEEHPGQLLPETVDRLLPGVRLGPVRFYSRPNLTRLASVGIDQLIEGIGALLYALFLIFMVGIQLLWWSFILYVAVAAITGFDPIGLDSKLGPDQNHPAKHLSQDWHPPMAR